ncbi:AAA family ATPase [Pseudonocardiaceae bacterium YIM PH 21723]|nr:AAA family ATPase [Pseudonocardiaceae bacterium YIM PH 21723]
MFLGATDPLPHLPRRILIAGSSGAGKTTLAGRIAAVTGIPRQDMDALHWGPNWTPHADFEDRVRAFAATGSWVCEWNYRQVKPLLRDRADTLIWLDYPRPFVMYRVIRRTFLRRWRREVLWAGNVEPPLRTMFTNDDHVVRYSWLTHDRNGEQARDVAAEPHITAVRLRSQSDVDRWLAGPLRVVAGNDGDR